MAKPFSIEVWNPNGKYKVISTKPMPGTRWIRLLTDQDCRVELTEDWGEVLFFALSKAGGKAFSNMAVGYNNVDVYATTKTLILTYVSYRFVGNLLKGQTVEVIGAGHIGSAYARMMIEGFKMNLIYYDLYRAIRLEKFVTGYGEFLKSNCFPVYLDSHTLYNASKLQVLVSY
ncbi:hypothetical protein GIB67_009729 [Kingdonia uniflora]|uniref:D-isomer specific 2-hydroxyacid dehydrogenase NAD-binding domain-containing protein n=1 Tax=Kingdonia uniflora TaxID=39325 RepID=A0A7J7LBG0_9MAGN|nr:hypothetical protein GIB67_009729 [Kingdonia uniflora]